MAKGEEALRREQDRKARQAAQLRANLGRRKEQKRRQADANAPADVTEPAKLKG